MNWRLATPLDQQLAEDLDALILVAPNMGPGEVLCFACGGIAKAKKLKPRPMPVLTPVVPRTRSVPNGAPMAEIQAIVNAAAGREVHPVPPPTEVEQDRELGSAPSAAQVPRPMKYIMGKSKVPAVTPAKVKKATKWGRETNELSLAKVRRFLAEAEAALAGALMKDDDDGAIEALEKKLTFWVRRELVVTAALAEMP